MVGSDKTGDARTQMRDALDVTNTLGQHLTELGEGSELEIGELLDELAEAQSELQVAWDLVRPEYEDLADIIDNQMAGHWWRQKLIQKLPVAVLETEADGRIIWANNAAYSMLDQQVLRLLRTPIQKFVLDADQEIITSLLRTLAVAEASPKLDKDAVIRMNRHVGGTMSVELVPTVRKEMAGDRTVVTWVMQPVLSQKGGVDESRIARTFSRLCMLPLQWGSLHDLLSEVARMFEDVCFARSSVSVSIGPPVEPSHLASSTEFAQRVDAAQMATGEGPCQHAWEKGEVVYSDNALKDTRWPKFSRAAEGTGVASVLAAPIKVGDDMLGVVNVYSKDESAFQPSGMEVIELLADAAGAVIHHAGEEKQLRDLTTQLEEAMISRDVIEQAKGILVGRYRCTPEEAFARLVKVSQHRNIRIRELARTLIVGVAEVNGV